MRINLIYLQAAKLVILNAQRSIAPYVIANFQTRNIIPKEVYSTLIDHLLYPKGCVLLLNTIIYT